MGNWNRRRRDFGLGRRSEGPILHLLIVGQLVIDSRHQSTAAAGKQLELLKVVSIFRQTQHEIIYELF